MSCLSLCLPTRTYTSGLVLVVFCMLALSFFLLDVNILQSLLVAVPNLESNMEILHFEN